jgi:hypothetical protein
MSAVRQSKAAVLAAQQGCCAIVLVHDLHALDVFVHVAQLHVLEHLVSNTIFKLLFCHLTHQRQCFISNTFGIICTPQLLCVQVARLLHALDRLASRKMFRLFRKAPNPTDVYDSSEGRHAYNRVIPLPLGLDDIQVRAETWCDSQYV